MVDLLHKNYMGSGHICLINTYFCIPILSAHHKPLWPNPPRYPSGELLDLCIAQLVPRYGRKSCEVLHIDGRTHNAICRGGGQLKINSVTVTGQINLPVGCHVSLLPFIPYSHDI